MEAGKVTWEGRVLKIDGIDTITVALDRATAEDRLAFERAACPTAARAPHVHGELDELLNRGARLDAAGQRHRAGAHADRRSCSLRAGPSRRELAQRWYGQGDPARCRAASPRSRHSRTRCASTSRWSGSTKPCCTCLRRPRGPACRHDAGHRPHLAQHTAPVRGVAFGAVRAHRGRAPGRRRDGHPR